jgi:ribosome-associated protein
MTSQEVLQLAVKTLDNKKAMDIKAIDIKDLTIIADYFLIASGSNTTQVKSLADELEFKLKQAGREPQRVEGYDSSTWILLDYGDVVVHLFYAETREFYNLERLWADGRQLDVSTLL